MPTFLVLQKGAVVKTIRGADPHSLRSAVSEAAKQAGAASGLSSSGGHVLGTSSQVPKAAAVSRPTYSGGGFVAALIRFFMLYLTTLLSFDPVAAAQASPYRKTKQ